MRPATSSSAVRSLPIIPFEGSYTGQVLWKTMHSFSTPFWESVTSHTVETFTSGESAKWLYTTNETSSGSSGSSGSVCCGGFHSGS